MTCLSSSDLVRERASTVLTVTPAWFAMPRIVVPDQPRRSKASLAAVTIASRVRAAAAARCGARYGRFGVLTGSAIFVRVKSYQIFTRGSPYQIGGPWGKGRRHDRHY